MKNYRLVFEVIEHTLCATPFGARRLYARFIATQCFAHINGVAGGCTMG